ncbi:A24 family peptidase [Winogradskya consettensis]|uniref:Prepilin peptidase n=1 Tax=Winogradskya consettensis TaxID=113560 RepID=A0A919SNB7_9ACTN|nr:A24 family peptidase [Actinoplanes consettensis]GIM74093.1 prepilin peptidase [Actinoplanes consettensis]
MSLPLTLGAALFGGAGAAFLPRVAHRLAVPRGTEPRTTCAHCDTPLMTWVRAGAACSCRRFPACTIGAGAVATGLLGAALGESLMLLVLLPATLLGVLLAVVDVSCLRLPNVLVAAFAVVSAGPLVIGGDAARVWWALGAAFACFVAYGAISILPGNGLGLGDVKLATVLAFVLGFAGRPALILGLLLPHLINGAVVLVLLSLRRVSRRTVLPFGPALLSGALLALVSTQSSLS